MNRREFIRGLGALAALASSRMVGAQGSAPTEEDGYPRARLVDAEGAPIRASALPPHEAYIFTYPYRATPNFLVNLGEEVEPVTLLLPNNESYTFPGGVGPQRAIVAYTAICPHAYSFPTARLGVISYRPPSDEHKAHIGCCAHLSAFDPAKGGDVIAGPAPHAVATVLLDYEEDEDTLTAVGILGEAHFESFFRVQREILREQYRSVSSAREVVSEARTVAAEAFSRNLAPCPVLIRT
jgi:arsenite oxidase small subunit